MIFTVCDVIDANVFRMTVIFYPIRARTNISFEHGNTILLNYYHRLVFGIVLYITVSSCRCTIVPTPYCSVYTILARIVRRAGGGGGQINYCTHDVHSDAFKTMVRMFTLELFPFGKKNVPLDQFRVFLWPAIHSRQLTNYESCSPSEGIVIHFRNCLDFSLHVSQ